MENTIENVITTDLITKSMSYETYRSIIRERIANNQSTGSNHSEAMVEYTKMNERRMKRLDRTVKLFPEGVSTLAEISTPQIWLVITEGWCGDAAQSVPIMVKMAEENPNIEIKFLLRDENLTVMDEFLTNGGRSIPKLIVLKKNNLKVLGSWGPRPDALQEIFLTAKKSAEFDYPEIQKEMQLWYHKDKGVSTQREILEVVRLSH